MGNDFLDSDGSRAERIAKYEFLLDCLCLSHDISLQHVPGFAKVIEYGKECLRNIQPGGTHTILQFKCPVAKKNAAGESISIALGGNCPDEKRWSICTIRCADQLFGGKDNLQKFLIFNLRVECRIDCESGRCAVCSPHEAKALGAVYEILCRYAFEMKAVMNFISLAGTTSKVDSELGDCYLKDKRHPDGTPYFVNYLPKGYHLSLLSYYCDKFRTIEEQVGRVVSVSSYYVHRILSPALLCSLVVLFSL